MSDLLQLLLLAVAAAFYPTLLAIVVLVLSRPNPARVLAWFLAGAAFVSVTIGLAAVLLLDTANFGADRHSAGAGVDIAVGGLAVVAGVILYRRRPSPKEPSSAKAEKGPSFSQRMLAHDSGWLVFALGMVLDLPGVWYLIALKDIALGDYGTGAEIVLVVGFNVIMFIFIEVPLLAYVFAPERTAFAVARFNAWLRVRVTRILGLIALIVGAFLLVRGIVAIV